MKSPLLEDEYRDLKKSFERLLATRAVVAEELKLDTLPELVVTASPKDVEGTMRRLCIPVENAYLWDDNCKLRDNPRVVHVPHFDKMPRRQHAALMAFLEEHCPANELEEDLVEFMFGADPIDVVIAQDEETGQLRYEIPVCGQLEEWALPCLVQNTMYQERAAKGLACVEMEGRGMVRAGGIKDTRGDVFTNGCLSPVTPEHELGYFCEHPVVLETVP